MGEFIHVLSEVLLIILLLPFSVAMIYFFVKAGRYGWLRAEELFFGRRLKRNFKQGESTDDET